MKRLQFSDVLIAVNDLGIAVPAEVGVEFVQAQSLITGVGEQLGNRGYDGRKLGCVVSSMAEYVEEDLEDAVLDLVIPLCRKIGVGGKHRGNLGFGFVPRRLDWHEDVVAGARNVGPPGRPDIEHRHLETIGPEQVQRHVSHQLEFALVGARLDLLEDVGPRWRLGIEVTPDDGIELFEAIEGRKVEIGKAIGREDDLAVLVQFKGIHVPITLFNETFAS